MSKKKIARIMPRSMKPIGEKLADIHCRNLGLQDGSPEYKEEFDSYMFDYNDEAYGLSMTPSGLIGQNPATPKVKEEFFREMKAIFGENGIIQKLDRNEYEKTKFDRILRGNIVSLAHFILDTKFGLKIKGKNGQPSDFDYGKLSDDKDEAGEERKVHVILNQYLRMYYVTQITKSLENILSTSGVGDAELLTKVFGDDWKKDPYTFLNNTLTRTQFIKYFYNENKGGSIKFDKDKHKRDNEADAIARKASEEKIKKKGNPILGKEYNREYKSNKNLYYFVDCVGLYFNKEKIDNDIEKRLKDRTISSLPIYFRDEKDRKNFINDLHLNYNISNADITRASMRLPVVLGTRKIDGHCENFVIIGRLHMLKVMELGLPSVDCIVYDQNETMNLIKPSEKTLKNLRVFNT